MYENLAILSAFIFLYSILSKGLERTPINGALVFTAFGFALGPLGLDLLKLDVTTEKLQILAELTLAIVLFSDAANSSLKVLKENLQIPLRLLIVALPLTILLGLGVGAVLFSKLALLEIAVLATLLAPTDAALGKAVISNKAVPANIREGLNIESGLNDGICVPILLILLTFAAGTKGDPTLIALEHVVEEIGIGVLVGGVITFLGALLIKFSVKRQLSTESWAQLPVIGIAVACFTTAHSLGGSGFIAAFSGGLLFNVLEKNQKHTLLLAAEGTGDTLALLTWVAFGAAVVGYRIKIITWEVVLYAVLSLTLIRMLPVFISLAGLELPIGQKLFIGWFGPRGLASVVFAIIVLNENLPGGQVITMTAAATIVLSVIAHGLSANPLVNRLKQLSTINSRGRKGHESYHNRWSGGRGILRSASTKTR